ncbi:MAG: hypothetical protein EOM20_04300 [Spartobacteria bacterium]|nr:hypothetical protein [Spartobacteria bacterium]
MKDVYKLGIIYISFIVCAILYWVVYDMAPGFHEHIVQGEDKLVEWITFFGFMGASIISFSIFRFRKTMTKFTKFYVFMLGLFFFVCAGEELSWGQRQLGFETPKNVEVINEQNEFNLHNIEFEQFKYLSFIRPKDIVSWFMKLFGMIVPFACWFIFRNPNHFIWRYFPPPGLIPCFLFPELIVMRQDTVQAWAYARYGETAKAMWNLQADEVTEMYWGLCAILAAWFIFKAWKANARTN